MYCERILESLRTRRNTSIVVREYELTANLKASTDIVSATQGTNYEMSRVCLQPKEITIRAPPKEKLEEPPRRCTKMDIQYLQ